MRTQTNTALSLTGPDDVYQIVSTLQINPSGPCPPFVKQAQAGPTMQIYADTAEKRVACLGAQMRPSAPSPEELRENQTRKQPKKTALRHSNNQRAIVQKCYQPQEPHAQESAHSTHLHIVPLPMESDTIRFSPWPSVCWYFAIVSRSEAIPSKSRGAQGNSLWHNKSERVQVMLYSKMKATRHEGSSLARSAAHVLSRESTDLILSICEEGSVGRHATNLNPMKAVVILKPRCLKYECALPRSLQ